MTLEDSACNDANSNCPLTYSKYNHFDTVDDSSNDSKVEKEIGCDHISPAINCDFCPQSPVDSLKSKTETHFSINEELITSFKNKCHALNGISKKDSSVLTHSSHSELSVYLQPFIHQVGGHLCMLKFEKETLCKPLQDKEQEFYEKQIPAILQPFIPFYYGTIEVKLEEDTDGYVNLVTPVNNIATTRKNDKNETLKANDEDDLLSSIQVKMKCTGSLEVLDPLQLNLFEKADPFNKNTNQSGEYKSYSFNPWSLKRHKEQIISMRTNNESSFKFIRLEDLTAKFKFPCVLDLKMGTRQHGDDAPEQKKISQRAKCEASTSSSLGVRICGMQVYQPEKGAFFCYDKYIGRKLSIKGFEDSLKTFFHTAIVLRSSDRRPTSLPVPDVVGAILGRLEALRAALASLDSYRFYSSSLLVMYDADVWRLVPHDDNGAPNDDHQTPPDGHDNGTRDCKEALTHVTTENGGVEGSESRSESEFSSQSTSSRSQDVHRSCGVGGGGGSKRICSRSEDRGSTETAQTWVRVKMIDFAHSTGQPPSPITTYHNDDGPAAHLPNLLTVTDDLPSPLHTGIDKGYLFGLDNLIRIIRSIHHSPDHLTTISTN